MSLFTKLSLSVGLFTSNFIYLITAFVFFVLAGDPIDCVLSRFDLVGLDWPIILVDLARHGRTGIGHVC